MAERIFCDSYPTWRQAPTGAVDLSTRAVSLWKRRFTSGGSSTRTPTSGSSPVRFPGLWSSTWIRTRVVTRTEPKIYEQAPTDLIAKTGRGWLSTFTTAIRKTWITSRIWSVCCRGSMYGLMGGYVVAPPSAHLFWPVVRVDTPRRAWETTTASDRSPHFLHTSGT